MTHDLYLMKVVRGRFGYPALRHQVIALRRQFPTAKILVEDTGAVAPDAQTRRIGAR
jgi:hypothetical protein